MTTDSTRDPDQDHTSDQAEQGRDDAPTASESADTAPKSVKKKTSRKVGKKAKSRKKPASAEAEQEPTLDQAADLMATEHAPDTEAGVLEHAEVVEQAHEAEPEPDDAYQVDEAVAPGAERDQDESDEADTPSEDDGGKTAEKKAPSGRKKSSKKSSSRSSGSGSSASGAGGAKSASGSKEGAAAAKTGATRMIVNYVPGEECRIAEVENGMLEEFHAERMDAISRVNNIYVGRVANVERGIQAAFIDFGIGESGFLHVTDLHPRYFPGADDDDSERVGRKTPRRERPPIEQALKRGQEVVVQVLKEGVGTKGPTLTSYLSIPGRYLVMMPQMDQVGVSRKVEDEQVRKDMRKILDGLDLPENFGFILRTAGIGRTKTELKRDLAYLQRLWKDLERRQRSGRAPRLLYSESDLLLRALRDFLTPEVDEIVIDDEHALRRASQFLKIAAPRSSVRLRKYTGGAPVFEAFGVEEQLMQMQSREVPLPSGGRLVIDQTEAVVAIDVNSGKMRSAKDSETNALTTNLEAVDAICRQLRLRDMGGIVINDMIDMRQSKNRKLVENRFKDRLKRDRARSSVAPISTFGILEMTRQRMRGSLHSQVFTDCPTCHGRGSVKRPSSVASESLRRIASLLSHDKVEKVELVVGPRVAGELLSKKRKALARLEHRTGKHVDVRVMDMPEPDRTVFYAYGPNNIDVNIERLPLAKNPEQWLEAWTDPAGDADWTEMIEEEEIVEEVVDPLAEQEEALRNAPDDEQAEGTGKKKRRRRRGGKRKGGSDSDGEANPSDEGKAKSDSPQEADDVAESQGESADGAGERDEQDEDGAAGGKKKRRRRRRGRGKGRSGEGETTDAQDAGEQAERDEQGETAPDEEASSKDADSGEDESGGEGGKKKRRRRRRGKKSSDEGAGDASGKQAEQPAETPSRKAGSGESGSSEPVQTEVKPKRRTLYGSVRRKLSPAEIALAAKRKE